MRSVENVAHVGSVFLYSANSRIYSHPSDPTQFSLTRTQGKSPQARCHGLPALLRDLVGLVGCLLGA